MDYSGMFWSYWTFWKASVPQEGDWGHNTVVGHLTCMRSMQVQSQASHRVPWTKTKTKTRTSGDPQGGLDTLAQMISDNWERRGRAWEGGPGEKTRDIHPAISMRPPSCPIQALEYFCPLYPLCLYFGAAAESPLTWHSQAFGERKWLL